MSESVPNNQQQPQKNKVTVVLDNSPIVEDYKKLLEEANQKIGSQQEIIQGYLAKDKEQFEREKLEKQTNFDGRRVPEKGGDTAPLESNSEIHSLQLNDTSCIPVELIKGKSVPEVINKIKYYADSKAENRAEFQDIYNKILKRSLSQNGTYEFQGNSARFENINGKIVPANRKNEMKRVD
jgi:hypothetical protein